MFENNNRVLLNGQKSPYSPLIVMFFFVPAFFCEVPSLGNETRRGRSASEAHSTCRPRCNYSARPRSFSGRSIFASATRPRLHPQEVFAAWIIRGELKRPADPRMIGRVGSINAASPAWGDGNNAIQTNNTRRRHSLPALAGRGNGTNGGRNPPFGNSFNHALFCCRPRCSRRCSRGGFF